MREVWRASTTWAMWLCTNAGNRFGFSVMCSSMHSRSLRQSMLTATNILYRGSNSTQYTICIYIYILGHLLS